MTVRVMVLLFLFVSFFGGSAAGTDQERILEFGNLVWGVKSSPTQIGPGPNYWSDSSENVWVDGEGMHLTIRRSTPSFGPCSLDETDTVEHYTGTCIL